MAVLLKNPGKSSCPGAAGNSKQRLSVRHRLTAMLVFAGYSYCDNGVSPTETASVEIEARSVNKKHGCPLFTFRWRPRAHEAPSSPVILNFPTSTKSPLSKPTATPSDGDFPRN